MSPLDVLGFATRALRGHRLRTALSLLGVAIGVAAVVALTALGEGARRYVLAQFASVGTNMVIVLPGKTETTGAMPGFGGVPHDLTLEDALAVGRGVREVDKLAPMVVGTETVAFGERRRQPDLLVDFTPSADLALERFWGAVDRWRDSVAAVTPEQLDTVGFCQYPNSSAPEEPFITIVWWTNLEFIHHMAEIALLRDLWRARSMST